MFNLYWLVIEITSIKKSNFKVITKKKAKTKNKHAAPMHNTIRINVSCTILQIVGSDTDVKIKPVESHELNTLTLKAKADPDKNLVG